MIKIKPQRDILLYFQENIFNSLMKITGDIGAKEVLKKKNSRLIIFQLIGEVIFLIWILQKSGVAGQILTKIYEIKRKVEAKRYPDQFKGG